MTEHTPIEYKWLDMDAETIYTDPSAFFEALRHRSGVITHRAIPNFQHNQCLFAAGTKRDAFGEPFSESEAIRLCRKLVPR
jgi:hypothetical protein